MLFTSSLLCTSWIKTQPAQKLFVQVNLYMYVCDRPLLKYTQTQCLPELDSAGLVLVST